ncbi:MAG TPA: DUF4231 domain-containing protein [Bryobacteraceae bacterium]|nr:DUF4231 domain-containing protein [Bryobacteraceae bacterium]
MNQSVIELQSTDTPETAAAKIKPEPKSVVVMLGSTDPSLQSQVRSLLSRAVAPLSLDSGALIIDDGSKSGAAAIMGLAAQDQDTPPNLLSIVRHETTEWDANHPTVMKLPAEWTETAKYTAQIAARLVQLPEDREKPILAILFGGSDSDKEYLVQCARREWPILVIAGSGGLADQIVKASAKPADGSTAEPIADPQLKEIVESLPRQFQIGDSVDRLERILVAHLEICVQTLADAWARYDDLDVEAGVKQRSFKIIQAIVLILGVGATFLVISQTSGAIPVWLKARVPEKAIHILIILVPIATSILVATNNRFRDGSKWILLRSAAEAVKSEIFRYRAQAGDYSLQQVSETSPEARLAGKIKDITSALFQSEVNKTNLKHTPQPDQGRLTFLTPDDYVTARLQNQVSFMVKKTANLNYQLKKNQIWIYVAGGLGTFLAAINVDVWVALTTSLATALTTKLESEQVENSLVQYNQALVSLKNIETWWKALSQWEKTRRTNIDLLVEQTEQTMEFELKGWAQQMQSALDKLTEKQSTSTDKTNAQTA